MPVTGDCFEDITFMRISSSVCNGFVYSETGMNAIKMQWNLPVCPGWKVVTSYKVCGSKGCTSYPGHNYSYHICGLPDEYSFNIMAMNTCTETVNATVTYSKGNGTLSGSWSLKSLEVLHTIMLSGSFCLTHFFCYHKCGSRYMDWPGHLASNLYITNMQHSLSIWKQYDL